MSHALKTVLKFFLPESLYRKLVLIKEVFRHDWLYCNGDSLGRQAATDSALLNTIPTVFCNLDDESQRLAARFVALKSDAVALRRLLFSPLCIPRSLAYDYSCLADRFAIGFSPEERAAQVSNLAALKAANEKYKICGLVETFVEHCGLRRLPACVHAYMAGKSFVDAGAWNGDSALIMLDFYSPAKVYAFELSPGNAQSCRETMRERQIGIEKCEVVVAGLSDRVAEVHLVDNQSLGCSLSAVSTTAEAGTVTVQLTTLDAFSEHLVKPLGFLKADIEGAEMSMLAGAANLLLRDRPVLSIAIYHSVEDFVGIYQYLNRLLGNYHFELQWLNPETDGDFFIIGYPCEIMVR